MYQHMSIFSHRGSQTDYERARKNPATYHLPAENTLDAFYQALERGADGIECDVVRTGDDKLAVTHSANLLEHVFHQQHEEIGYVGHYSMAELKERFRVGPRGDGVMPELSEVLALMQNYHNKRPVRLNIELKGIKGNAIPKLPENDVKPLIKDYLLHTGFPLEHVIISSFSTEDMVEMEQMDFGVKLAQLCGANRLPIESIYVNHHDDQYRHFTPDTIKHVAHNIPSLSAIHAEIQDIDEACLLALKEHHLTLGTWALNEDARFLETDQCQHILKLIQRLEIATYFITDFMEETKAALSIAKLEP